ncbi:MAG: hypothetical protein DRO40_13390 [Thermoprotei archaeon]|nr:hypothetical protein [Thermoprotei archaeon]RLG78921.1 MAG: hypothetical protein DRO40_13390 [Thermoprotei archaeon]
MMDLEAEIDGLSNEVRNFINEIRECIRSIRNVMASLDEIKGMLNRGEISKETYLTLRNEYRMKMIPYIEAYLGLRDKMEGYRDRLNLALTRIRLELRDLRKEMLLMDEKRARFDLRRRQERMVQDLLSELESLRKELDLSMELMMLEEYLNFLKENPDRVPKDRLYKYRDFINELLNRWSNEKIKLTERLEGLERKVSEINDEIRLNEIRFSLGEYDHGTYNERRIALEGQLNDVQNRIQQIQRTIEETDMRILRCSSLLEELGA